MHSTNLKFEIGQPVYLINPSDDTLLHGEILEGLLQVAIGDNTLNFKKSYIVRMSNGIHKDEQIVYPEFWVFSTLSEAASTLEPNVND